MTVHVINQLRRGIHLPETMCGQRVGGHTKTVPMRGPESMDLATCPDCIHAMRTLHL